MTRFRSATGVAMLTLACAPSPDPASVRPAQVVAAEADAAPAPIPRAALEQVVDSVFTAGLAAEKIPGGVFIMVQNGRVVLAKGYGVANVKTRQPVLPGSTLWRIGSISKVMTATGVVQLADRGKVRLDEDVNAYLRTVRVPATHREPVTARNLLTHTAGFDELPGRSAASREAVLPLGEFLGTRLVRVRRPGTLVAYSSYGPALAGALIEDVSGLPLETYLERNIWGPLGMHATNVTPRGAMPTGYGVRNDTVVDATWEWSNTAPAGSMNSTAVDMGRFMNMMLGHHPRGRRVLSDAARRSMLTRQITMHPRVAGMGLGFFEARVGGNLIFEHGGDIDGYSSLLVLLPDEGTGFFVATHVEGARLRGKVRDKLLERFFAGPGSGSTKANAGTRPATRTDLAPFAGDYRWNIFCRTCKTTGNSGIVRVTALGDSALAALQTQWFPVGPLLFQNRDGSKQIGFARDSAGAIWQLTDGGIRNFERVRP